MSSFHELSLEIIYFKRLNRQKYTQHTSKNNDYVLHEHLQQHIITETKRTICEFLSFRLLVGWLPSQTRNKCL